MTPDPELSRREREVAVLVAEGLTNREIALRLYISERTADGHLEHIREKLGFRTRAQIASWITSQSRPAVSSAVPGGLPDARTSFVGRTRELEEVKLALARSRIVTITGPGGCGKTRLAVEVAHELGADFAGGAWLVELAGVREATLVPDMVVAALRLREDASRRPIETITDSLRQSQLLLLLDNCEHLRDAAAALADQLLGHCAEVRILATSREALRIDGERRVPLLSLSLPPAGADADAVARSEAGRLFLDRALAVSPTIQVDAESAAAVRSICERLDGMPLAIELAAARVGFLTPLEIDQRLSDRFRLLGSDVMATLPHHQTLRALIDWSHGLLNEEQAVLYRRLAVFVGGFTLEAAERVCDGEPLSRAWILGGLAELVQKSLVTTEEESGRTRYRMLETIHEHALERLEMSGEMALRARHAAYFLELLDRSENELAGPDHAETSGRIEREFDNVRAAFRWGIQGGDAEASLRLVAHRRFWQVMQGHTLEGHSWFEEALALTNPANASLRADVLAMSGELQRVSGRLGRARSQLEEALAIQRTASDRGRVGKTLHMLGRVELTAGRLGRAAELTEESVAIAAESSDLDMPERLAQLGEILYSLGRPEPASATLSAASEAAVSLGDAHSEADALRVLGMIARDAGRMDAARASLEKALALQRELRDSVCVSLTLSVLADVALLDGGPRMAESAFAEALEIQREVGYRLGMPDCLWGLSAVALTDGSMRRAAVLAGAAEQFRRVDEIPFRLAHRQRHDGVLELLRREMPTGLFDDGWSEGLAMGRDEALGYALAARLAR